MRRNRPWSLLLDNLSTGRLRISYDSLTILVVASIIFAWFGGLFVLYGLDSWIPIEPSTYLNKMFYGWADFQNTGLDNASNIALLGIISILYVLHNILQLPITISQMLLYYMSFSIGGIGLFRFVKYSFPSISSLASLSAPLFYMLNPFNMRYIWFSMLPASVLIFAGLPWLMLSYARILDSIEGDSSLGWGNVTMFVISALCCGSANVPLIFSAIVLLFGYFLYYAISSITKGVKLFLLRIVPAVLPLLGFFLFNAYWIIPEYQLLQVPGLAGVAFALGHRASGLYLQQNSAFTSLAEVIRVLGLFNSSNSLRWWESIYANDNLLTLSLFLVPFFSLIMGFIAVATGLRRFSTRTRQVALVSLTLAILLVFVIAGLKGPFAPLLQSAVANRYGGFIFTSPYLSFGLAFVLSYSILLSLGLAEFLRRTSARKFFCKVTPIGIVALIMIASWPMMTGQFVVGNPFPNRVAIPTYVSQTANYLQPRLGPARVLSIPSGYSFVSENWTYGYVGNNIFPAMGDLPTIVTYFPQGFSPMNNISSLAYSLPEFYTGSGYSNVLSMLGVKYVMVREDAGFIPGYIPYSNVTRITQFMNSTKGLIQVAIFGERTIYLNEVDAATVFAPSSVVAYPNGSIPLEGIMNPWQEQLCGTYGRSLRLIENGTYGSTVTLSQSQAGFEQAFNCNPLQLNYNFTSIALRFRTDENSGLIVWGSTRPRIDPFDGNLTTYESQFTLLRAIDAESVSSTQPVYSSTDWTTIHFSVIGNIENYYQVPTGHFNFLAIQPVSLIQLKSRDQFKPINVNLGSIELSNYRFLSDQFNPLQVALGPFALSVKPPSVEVKEADPTLYTVSVQNSNGEFILVMDQTFDPRWTIDGAGIQVLSHFLANYYANGWLLRPSKSDTHFQITFVGQRVIFNSVVISLVSIAVAVLFDLTYYGLRRRSKSSKTNRLSL